MVDSDYTIHGAKNHLSSLGTSEAIPAEEAWYDSSGGVAIS